MTSEHEQADPPVSPASLQERDDDACPECYIAGSVSAFREQHQADRRGLSSLLEELEHIAAEMQANKWAPSGEFVGDEGFAAQWAARLLALLDRQDAPPARTE